MIATRRTTRRVDRAALGATFAAALMTLGLSTAAMEPSATPLTAAIDIAALVARDTAVTEPAAAPTPCPHVVEGSRS